MNDLLRKLGAAAVGVAVLAGTFVAAAAIGDATDDGVAVAEGAAQPARPAAASGAPQPAGDDSAEPGWPAQSAVQPVDEAPEARARQDGPDPDADPGVVEPISAAAPAGAADDTTSTTAADPPAAAGDEPDPVSGDDAALHALGLLGELTPLPWFRFLDPCADAEEDACGEGVGGTILPLSGGESAAPLRLGSSLYEFIAITALGEQCDIGTRPDGSVGVILFTNNPAELDVTWWRTDAPGEVHDAGTFTTTDEEREDWLVTLAGGRVPNADAGGVLNCLDFPATMASGVRHGVRVTGRDDLGTEATATYSLTPPSRARSAGGSGRPPVRFAPVDERHGRVVAALDDAAEEALWVAELVRNGPEATPQDCTSIENEVLAGSRIGSFRLFNEEVAPLVIPTADTYPYERRFDTAASSEYWPGEGASATICTWITRPPARSFDKPVVLQRSALDVTAPRWYRTRISVIEAQVDGEIAAGTVTARVEEGGFSSFGRADVFPDGTTPGRTTLAEPVAVADSGANMHPYEATVAVASEYGEVRTVVSTPNKLCPVAPPSGARCPSSYTDVVTVRIPGPRAGSGLCGSSFGECEPPTRETFLGELVLAVESYAGPSGPPAYGEGFSAWDISTGGFAAADAPELPAYVQLDWNRSSGVAAPALGGGRPVVTLVLNTDRPASATASSIGWEGTGACGLAPQTQPELTTNHVFRWDAACFGTEYYLEVTFTDGAGRATRFGPGGEQHLAAVVSTEPYELVSLDVDVTVTPKAPSDFSELDLYVDGAQVPIVAGPLGRCRDTAKHLDGQIRNEGGYPLRVGEPLYVAVAGRLDAGPDCDEYDRIDLSGSVSLVEALAGPVELRFEDDRVSAVVTVSAVGRTPLAVPAP